MSAQQEEQSADVITTAQELAIFLVRTAPLLHGGFRLFLCVRIGNKGDVENDVFNIIIVKLGESYQLSGEKTPAFKSIPDLIAYYQVHRLPCGVRLNSGVKRERWLLRHNDIEYDEVAGRLGSGNFCTVYRGTLVRRKRTDEAREVAIKRSNRTESENQGAELDETRKQLIAEAKIMNQYNNDYVIKFYGLACDKPPFMVVMEFCAGGSLDSHLKKLGKEMEPFEKHVYLIETARGMRYLHSQNCLHRDLASRNCLISSEGVVKIADFGLSRTLLNGNVYKEALKEAPLRWMAPECIKKESEFSFKSDVWAYGVLIFEIYTNAGKPFADEQDDMKIVRAIKHAKMPPLAEAPPEIQTVLKKIWTLKPEDRPTFQGILELLVECLKDCTMANVKKMLVNNIPNVRRTRMPNLDTKMEIQQASHTDPSSDKNRTSRRDKRQPSSRRKQSNDVTARRKTVRKRRNNTDASTVDNTQTSEMPKTIQVEKEKTPTTAKKADEPKVMVKLNNVLQSRAGPSEGPLKGQLYQLL
ncbi:unnamed protein product [Caenorhabditis auriculariae]|uniref:Protein kinase domain-containing protein n=1 Tax=Caenorhabditis auriculariae TaxID=2777116 RepID=A0A8S1HWL7_9PELO|nr:unnamed protein product [Caenorhabditis auriculariae]